MEPAPRLDIHHAVWRLRDRELDAVCRRIPSGGERERVRSSRVVCGLGVELITRAVSRTMNVKVPLGATPGAGLGVSEATVITMLGDDTSAPDALSRASLIGTFCPLLSTLAWL